MNTNVKTLRRALMVLVSGSEELATMPLRDTAMLVRILEKDVPVSATDIKDFLGIPQPKVSQIGARLTAAGLVTKFKEGGNKILFCPTNKAQEMKDSLPAWKPEGADNETT